MGSAAFYSPKYESVFDDSVSYPNNFAFVNQLVLLRSDWLSIFASSEGEPLNHLTRANAQSVYKIGRLQEQIRNINIWIRRQIRPLGYWMESGTHFGDKCRSFSNVFDFPSEAEALSDPPISMLRYSARLPGSNYQPSAFAIPKQFYLAIYDPGLQKSYADQKPCKEREFKLNVGLLFGVIIASIIFAEVIGCGFELLDGSDNRFSSVFSAFIIVVGSVGLCSSLGTFALGSPIAFWRFQWLLGKDDTCYENQPLHSGAIVLQKYLDKLYYCSTVNGMANVLNTDKQIAVIGALTEGSSIRSIERITGVHRDTIMRLGVKVGQGCAKVMDTTMRNLPCNRLEMDEIWGFVGKKDRNVREGDEAVGSVWTFCAIDAETKLVPAFKVGNRDVPTAKAFVQDVAERMAYRVQISTDGLNAYVAAMESAFGEFVDYGQIIKTYGHEEASDNRRYSAPKFVSCEKKVMVGNPDERLISTSYVERLNATTRLHMRRLTRLTLAFSKKRENFEAAVALHFAYYNFVKRHNTLRCTPAMAAGVANNFWSVGDLVEAAA
jgi:IS1 family transposase